MNIVLKLCVEESSEVGGEGARKVIKLSNTNIKKEEFQGRCDAQETCIHTQFSSHRA